MESLFQSITWNIFVKQPMNPRDTHSKGICNTLPFSSSSNSFYLGWTTFNVSERVYLNLMTIPPIYKASVPWVAKYETKVRCHLEVGKSTNFVCSLFFILDY